VVWLKDASGAGRRTAERLGEHAPRIVLREGGISDVASEVLFEADIPVWPAEDVTIREVDELAVARESEVVAAIEAWEDRAAEREREQTAELVDQVISEHRAERDG
jgi:predicted RNase H-like nuclease (RuvC/YqgF family)